MLQQVWLNLLDNAIKFSDKNGKVEITAQKGETGYIFTFANQGTPIPPEAQIHIFDKFFQGDKSHTKKGNGLGLSIAARIVDLHGGTMRRGVHMNMDTAGVVDLCTSGSELAHKLLHRFDVLVFTDGRHKFHRVVPTCRTVVTVAATDRGVADHFPLSVLLIPNCIGVIDTAHMSGLCTKVSGDNPCRRTAGQSGHLNLNAEVLISQPEPPPFADGAPTAEEGVGRGFLGFGAAEGEAVPERISIKSRTPAGTVFP